MLGDRFPRKNQDDTIVFLYELNANALQLTALDIHQTSMNRGPN